MLEAKFPIYALRANLGREEEPPFVLICSIYDRYILDIPMLGGDYQSRRLKMLSMDLDYPLYPLKERFSNLSQVLNSTRKEFIDANGKIWKLSRKVFYNLKSYPVLHYSKTWKGTYLLQTKIGNFVSDSVGKYVTIVETPKGSILFEVSDNITERVRIKV